jgi:hypothetical protein
LEAEVVVALTKVIPMVSAEEVVEVQVEVTRALGQEVRVAKEMPEETQLEDHAPVVEEVAMLESVDLLLAALEEGLVVELLPIHSLEQFRTRIPVVAVVVVEPN